MTTLAVPPDDVLRLTQLAREFHAQDAVVMPDTPGSLADEWPHGALAGHESDASLDEFRSIVRDLEPDQQMQVVALLWVGRGDYDVEEWEQAVSDARDAWNPRTADYLIAHPMLADQIEEGMQLLGYDLE
ncbi:MAG: DUF3775 domain-containing protein [Gammaproteobacteria bacterium]|nr:MAG: DUF3775 domain-containing protein [Gammaproteobacteria bacterium]